MQRYALPWTLEQIDLGSDVIEIGPGYAAATEILLLRVGYLRNRIEVIEALQLNQALCISSLASHLLP